MQPISRRSALILAGAGAAAAAAGGAGLWWALNPVPFPAGGAALAQPAELRSTGGRLLLTLAAGRRQLQIGGRQGWPSCYNGSLPGPTLRLQAGDELTLRLVNNLDEPTNLHMHGLHVSPQGNSDNVFVTVRPGGSFDYDYRLPSDHPPGVYWYHPHRHGLVAGQIFAGLFGAIIVEDAVPADVSADRVLIVSDTSLDAAGNIAGVLPPQRLAGREGDLLLLNGQSAPLLTARPGERERWRIVNTCVARHLRLRLDGQDLQLLGMDSGRFHSPQATRELLLAPGNRADLLVTAVAGESTLLALPYDRGSLPAMMALHRGPVDGGDRARAAGHILATFRVAGEPAAPPAAFPAGAAPEDLRPATVAARRQFTFAMGPGSGGMGGGMGAMMRFTINGHEYRETRTDTTVAAGTIEEWTLVNTSSMDHPFHLHVWPMQVLAENGRPTEPVTWRDVVNVPAYGRVSVRIAFRDFTGRSVYHCHILDHEDLGMMGVVEVS